MRKIILLAGSALALGFAISTPAQAQAVCDLADGLATENTGGATATDPDDFACGEGATADGGGGANGATAIGTAANAVGADATAVGSNSNATGSDATAIGADAKAIAISSTAVGSNALASGVQATSVGTDSIASGLGSSAIGAQANASGLQSIAIGLSSDAHGDTTIAIGDGAIAGPVAGASGVDHDGVAIGDKAKATGFHSTAIGGEAVASGAGSQAFGWKANATGTQAAAFGNQAQATGAASTALGNLANASGANSTALGNGAIASGTNSTAIGQGASTAGFANSVALGTGTVNTAANQVNVGNRTIGGLANGVLANDAVNMSQLNAAIGDITALENSVGSLLQHDRAQDRNIGKANEGIAMALALDSPNIPAGAHFALSGGVGYYNGKTSFASAISMAISDMTSVSAGIGYGLNSGEIGARAGFQVAW